jgi:hypothetical protein
MPLNPDLFTSVYKPDVLSCLADLSNDEVFTPPDVANKMLDMLPQELFRNPNIKFLDPACKSGVFLREIAKRLIAGLADKIPNLQERCDWIFKNQLYGIAITELTSLLSRRSVYCSKYANSPFAITKFDNVEGNVLFHKIKHTWQNGKCIFCGTAENGQLNEIAREGMESHAYEFIHTLHPEDIFNMKFDVIISNPPYQLNDGGNGVSASPIYQYFIEQAKKLNPRYLTMIVPSRWFAGGKGLDKFRKEMLNDRHLVRIVDYINAKDCFPQNSISGGVNYFLWDRDHERDCEFTTIMGDREDTQIRKLNEFPVFVRYNAAVDMIHKIMATKFKPFSEIVSSRNPFGLPTSARGDDKKKSPDMITLVSSKGRGYIYRNDVVNNPDMVDQYKIMVSRITYEHAGEPDKDGMFRVLSRIEILKPQEVCTDSYLVIGPFDTENEATNCADYLRSKFARFLISQTLSAINLSKDKFGLIPMQDFTKPVDVEALYSKYGFTKAEVEFIDSLIHDFGGED